MHADTRPQTPLRRSFPLPLVCAQTVKLQEQKEIPEKKEGDKKEAEGAVSGEEGKGKRRNKCSLSTLNESGPNPSLQLPEDRLRKLMLREALQYGLRELNAVIFQYTFLYIFLNGQSQDKSARFSSGELRRSSLKNPGLTGHTPTWHPPLGHQNSDIRKPDIPRGMTLPYMETRECSRLDMAPILLDLKSTVVKPGEWRYRTLTSILDEVVLPGRTLPEELLAEVMGIDGHHGTDISEMSSFTSSMALGLREWSA
ncbi:hypothetical protein E5288_WYG003600 [Bos mutus]|uniref:Uncharacterized protein n=1 Tax=Bos mutus TaxID=72004 RepID=A0A6B0RWI3_9CETA|nr:hypothetical protein [Bos mutus]